MGIRYNWGGIEEGLWSTVSTCAAFGILRNFHTL